MLTAEALLMDGINGTHGVTFRFQKRLLSISTMRPGPPVMPGGFDV